MLMLASAFFAVYRNVQSCSGKFFLVGVLLVPFGRRSDPLRRDEPSVDALKASAYPPPKTTRSPFRRGRVA